MSYVVWNIGLGFLLFALIIVDVILYNIYNTYQVDVNFVNGYPLNVLQFVCTNCSIDCDTTPGCPQCQSNS